MRLVLEGVASRRDVEEHYSILDVLHDNLWLDEYHSAQSKADGAAMEEARSRRR